MKTSLLAAALLLIPCSLSPSAKDKHLPLAPQLISAKTVYIDNQSGSPTTGDHAYQELSDWGRFQIVQDKSQADLVFLLTMRSETVGATFMGGPDVHTFSVLTVLDAKTGKALWTDSRVAGIIRQRAPIKTTIDNLRKRIEEEAAQPKKR